MSTTGAYGDFPPYYYEKGNLFGAYLQGHTPPQSWDVRMELEYLGGANPASRPVRPRRQRVRRRHTPRKPATTKLGAYAYRNLTGPATARVLAALGGADSVDGDPHERFDAWVATHLTVERQETVLVRLKLLMVEAEKARKRVRHRKPRKNGQPVTKNQRKRETSQVAPKPKSVPKRQDRPVPRVCALCSVQLSDAERARSARLRSIFLDQAYCTEHADKLESLLAPGRAR